MIIETLKILFIDNCTMQEAAEKLAISQSSMRDRLAMLQHMGYVQELCNNSGPKTSACCSCSAAPACHTETGSFEGKAYQLTEKGKRMCYK
ncbi:winged helix-turn-helix domain-containing protein [Methanolobus psychrotolerans]|uniref:winged helix-turn-helix domain-containing protein n=1 Tax=Methanolobus psychrotolerans TaxID=1874706 RepID=UPI000B918B9C|nr:winged helix-turn-helix domain-containing protein [Methanolobus psychrotolerans]